MMKVIYFSRNTQAMLLRKVGRFNTLPNEEKKKKKIELSQMKVIYFQTTK